MIETRDSQSDTQVPSSRLERVDQSQSEKQKVSTYKNTTVPIPGPGEAIPREWLSSSPLNSLIRFAGFGPWEFWFQTFKSGSVWWEALEKWKKRRQHMLILLDSTNIHLKILRSNRSKAVLCSHPSPLNNTISINCEHPSTVFFATCHIIVCWHWSPHLWVASGRCLFFWYLSLKGGGHSQFLLLFGSRWRRTFNS